MFMFVLGGAHTQRKALAVGRSTWFNFKGELVGLYSGVKATDHNSCTQFT